MNTSRNRTGLVLGAVLVAIGILSLASQFLGGIGFFWPFFVIGIGAAFFVGMVLGGKPLGALAIPGSIITGIGLMLFVQNLFGVWESWSYSWALIITFVGAGLVVYGAWSDLPDLRKSGWNLVRLGIVLFLIFGAIFELLFSFLGVSDARSGLFWPAALIAVGLFLLASRSYRLLRDAASVSNDDRDLFWPVLFMGIGALWILVNIGLLPAGNVTALLRLWPLLLIVAGLELIVGRRIPWTGAVLGIGLVGVLVFMAFSGPRLGLTSPGSWFLPGITLGNGRITETVTGSGNVIIETREASGFDRVSLSGIGDAEIIQGDREGLAIEADDNLLPYITSEVRGGRLEIEIKRGVSFRSVTRIHYTIYVKDLQDISLSGAGTVTCDNLASDRLLLDASGLGNFKFNNVQVDDLRVSISGSGSSQITGETKNLEAEISGAGSFLSPDLKSAEASVEISGMGKAVVWATDRLETSISGAGSISYYGSPKVTKGTAGLGTVTKAGDK